MSTFEHLLIEQRTAFDRLRRILPNYRKIGKEKFTASKTCNHVSALQETWTECKGLHVKLQQKATEAMTKHDYFAREEFLEAEDDFEEAMDSLTELLEQQQSPPSRAVAPKEASESTFFGDQRGGSDFALPRIKIPAFRGEPTEWESFRDSFSALVGSNDTLTEAQKLYFLKSFLEGEAALLVEHIQVSDANYDEAWQLLIGEYDNSRALVQAHIHALASLPVMNTETIAELKQLRDTASASLSALNNLKRPVEHWDDLLVYIVSQKFSPRTRTEWNLRLGASDEYPSFPKLREFLTERIRGIAEPVSLVDVSAISNAVSGGAKGKAKATVHNATVRKCPCCAGNHALAFCKVLQKKSVDQHYQVVKQARMCFNSLKPGHFPAQSPSENGCLKCQKSHLSLSFGFI